MQAARIIRGYVEVTKFVLEVPADVVPSGIGSAK